MGRTCEHKREFFDALLVSSVKLVRPVAISSSRLAPTMSALPVKHTFIHFCFQLPRPRSLSSPPCHAPVARVPGKRRRLKKRHKPILDDDAAAFHNYRSITMCETWAVLCTKILEKSVENAKGQSVHVPSLRAILPGHLFGDWAWYTFPRRDSVEIAELFGSGFLRKNGKLGVQLCCSDSLYHDPKTEYFRNLCVNAEKMLESRDKNYFSILVNSDMVVFLLYDGDALIKDIANKIRQILGIAGAPVATHRNRPLKLSGTISSNLIRAGNKFSLDFL